jgi:hypothetical protein
MVLMTPPLMMKILLN